MVSNSRPRYGQKMIYEEYERLGYLFPEQKYEHIGGRVYSLTGGSREHSTICVNVQGELRNHFRARSGPGFVVNGDMAVQVGDATLYPDVTVSCDPADRKRGNRLIKSPRVIVEVLSPGTEDKDKNAKLEAYKASSTIEEILLINQFTPEVMFYSRSRNAWELHIYRRGGKIPLNSIGTEVSLDDIYYKVDFDEPLEEE